MKENSALYLVTPSLHGSGDFASTDSCPLCAWAMVHFIHDGRLTAFFSISVLLLSTMYQMNRNSGSEDYHHPFTYLPTYRILDSLVDPRLSRSEQGRIKRQEEEFKPFVFKVHPVYRGLA